jgi:hypothetical protein
VEQLEVLPQLVTACGFASAKEPGYEADDFLAAAAAREERRGGTVILATGDRDAYQLVSVSTTVLQPIRAGEMARIGPAEVRARYGVEPWQVPDFIALRGDASDRIPGLAGVRAVRQPCCANMARSRRRSRLAASRRRRKCSASTSPLPPWTKPRHCRPCATASQIGARQRPWRVIGSSTDWQIA